MSNPIEDAINSLRRAHNRVMRHDETYLLSGVVLLGETSLRDDIPTACTNGRDKFYNPSFINPLIIEELVFLVLHEAWHIQLRHIQRYPDLIAEDPQTANAAMDYVVNDIIINLKDKTLAKMPKGGLYDPKFHDWSVREIYNFLRNGKNKDGKDEGKPQPSPDGKDTTIGGKKYKMEPMDSHDTTMVDQLSPEEAKELNDSINDAIQEAGLFAGIKGDTLPRAVSELLQVEVKWEDELREFVSARVRGNDEYTFAKLNRKRLASGLYRPSTYNEKVGTVVCAIDTSGSITPKQIDKFATELASICDVCNPDEVLVLWWDTSVKGEQRFSGTYSNLRHMFKPVGGGGTRVSSVSDYLIANRVEADCMVVFTDGYVESDINWRTPVPTLWVVTENTRFVPPAGRVVNFK
jgi:predicted metal-dependent peptidase